MRKVRDRQRRPVESSSSFLLLPRETLVLCNWTQEVAEVLCATFEDLQVYGPRHPRGHPALVVKLGKIWRHQMDRRDVLKGMGAAAIIPLAMDAEAQDTETIYELRTYHLNEGKEPLILARFR